VLRVLVDRPRTGTRFLVLGSASPNLLKQSSETLAGRIIYHELQGFSLDEVGMNAYPSLWLRGGLPRSFISRTHKESDEWRSAYIQTFLERDIPQLGIRIGATTLRRFWNMIAHYHGNIWNASEFARSFGVADTTVRHYLDLLTDALVIRQLPAWHENISKRQVKAPKVYIQDSGLLHSLLKLKSIYDLESHPKVGASWEGFVISELIQRLGVRRDDCYFWATYGGAELDLLVVYGKKRLGFEIKRTTSPRVTKSMHQALKDLRLQQIYVIHCGDNTFPLSERIKAVSLTRLLDDIIPLR
jgi:predicted AAA+ superfamily ATPase